MAWQAAVHRDSLSLEPTLDCEGQRWRVCGLFVAVEQWPPVIWVQRSRIRGLVGGQEPFYYLPYAHRAPPEIHGSSARAFATSRRSASTKDSRTLNCPRWVRKRDLRVLTRTVRNRCS